MDEEAEIQSIRLEAQQSAFLALLRALETAADALRPALAASLLEELQDHVRGLEQAVFPAAEALSLGARHQVAALRAEQRAMLRELSELRPQLVARAADLESLRQRLLGHLGRERDLLGPLLSRLAWVRAASYLEVDPRLRVRTWSAGLEQAAGVAADEVVGRPLEEVWRELRGGSRMALALPAQEGATAWYPPWAERVEGIDPARVRALVKEGYPQSVRPGLEGALEDLRATVQASRAEIHLVNPREGGAVWRAFPGGGSEASPLARQTIERGVPLTHRAETAQVWVPMRGLEGVVGALGLVWEDPDAWLQTGQTLLLWVALPLTFALEPLLDSLRYPGESPLSPGVCARILGFS